jgi:hypothetical protein
MSSNPDLAVEEEFQKANLDMTVRYGARSLDLKVARILSEAVTTTWEVH